ncbi:alpha-glucan family phosphorylase [Muricauda oceani]|uniref:Glycosyltransferase family 1 protein n=1 Tax=Flagellimonas oceani TaxID=2698672 RepID=A0A6G7J4R3_9FLAO|nr:MULTISPECIES: alpha-glucan family phosphorylase [Allomuricauda]MBW8242832.1 alpha-glucan family phosphorylase [Allomuricauda oceani]QII45437.1 glycosyltransferase family 1 protein [Allomuricauda oceani]
MKKQKYSTDQFYGLMHTDVEGIDALIELALNIRWSWNHASDELWQQLDPELWEFTRNPWVILQTVSRDRLEERLTDPAFREKLKGLLKANEQANSAPSWFQEKHPKAALTTIAYFSMEYMLNEALPIYAGGLGNVAGDQLKAASDLGVPVVAVGLLYAKGYFRQEIDKYGTQNALFPYNDPGQLPVTPLRLPNGEWLRIKVSLPGHPIWLRAWQVQVGRSKLYLLDSNDAANLPIHRGITDELYGGGPELRIKQEIILGVGGYRLLKALDIKPEVCHMNEGHAAFLVLERANDFMKANGTSFEEALAVTRAGNLFTTHTAVAAGFDHFSPSSMEYHLGTYAKEELGLDFNDLMALGRADANNRSESFNMAYLAIRGSGAVNGVSRLHGEVSRNLFNNLFPRWPEAEVPVGHVTNGVHMPCWDSKYADEIWTESCGKDRWRGELDDHSAHISKLSDEKLWEFRNRSRNRLVDFIRERFERQAIVSGLPSEVVTTAEQVFDPNTLTLGFARRFVPYKRPDLLLHDPERFVRILTNPEHPVQLVLAGKAPPFDEAGKGLIRKWVQFIQQHNLHRHVLFLSDYDMMLAENLVQGVDVWLNTPRRPWEASGTSGMKVLVNGGLNLSVLDGWWAEAYTPEVGWALGDGQEHGDDPAWDAHEAAALYEILEQQVVPEFYARNKKGVSEIWVERMRKSMATLTPRFSANRTVREYTEDYYLPAAINYKKCAARKGAKGKRIVGAGHELKAKWDAVKFGQVQIESERQKHHFKAPIWLNGINPKHVQVELFAEGINGGAPEKIKMKFDWMGENGAHNFYAQVITDRPTDHFTVRIVPSYEGVSVPLEDNLILWQH